MKPSLTLIRLLAALALPLAAADPPLDVNDVSFLFPVPQTPEDVEALIPMDLKLKSGDTLLPADVFKRVLDNAEALEVPDSAGSIRRITFADDAGIRSLHTWKVAGIRINPSALGTTEKQLKDFGQIPGLRLIVQPVSVGSGGKVTVHDSAAHVLFNFLITHLDPKNGVRAVPDLPPFEAVVKNLRSIKKLLADAHVETSGRKLAVHPGFNGGFNHVVPGFAEALKALLVNHLSAARLDIVSFMGVEDAAEPWIFFSMSRTKDGFAKSFVKGSFPQPPPGGQLFNAQMSQAPVSPKAMLRDSDLTSITTALLFEKKPNDLVFPSSANAEAKKLLVGDIADRIANPDIHHNLNTDCVSCHTETTRRKDLHLPLTPGAYKLPARERGSPADVSGVDDGVLPAAANPSWNFRNFGWFPDFFEDMRASATVTVRAANEAAASADFINRTVAAQSEIILPAGDPASGAAGAAAPVEPVKTAAQKAASPLTLVLDIKSKTDHDQLKAALEKLLLPEPPNNKNHQTLDALGMVHFARFGFIGEDKVFVITEFDDSMERYVSKFVKHMGDTFNILLAHVKDAPPLPVQDHKDDFLRFVNAHNLEVIGPFYSAYPKLGVQDILLLQKQADEKKQAEQGVPAP